MGVLVRHSINKFKDIFGLVMLLSIVLLLYLWNNVGEMRLVVAIPSKICNVNLDDHRLHFANKTEPMIYYVTPTYPRPEQIPELTRLSHTLMHVPRIHWIVADDQPLCADYVLNVLQRSGVPFTHLSTPKPKIKAHISPRGVSNRRAAIDWLQNNVKSGILYFGDDDNTVDLRLFDEIRLTKKVSMFPVGLIESYGVSSPVVRDGKVIGFFDSWAASRRFAVDMAGFAVNIKYLTPSASMPYIAGYEEDKFLISLGLKLDDIEPLADNCSKILVWHTRTQKFPKQKLKINVKELSAVPNLQNFVTLLKETARIGMASLDSEKGIPAKFAHHGKMVPFKELL